VDDDVLSTEGCHSEFFGTDTSEADCLPNLRYIGFLGSIEGSLVSLKLYISLGKLLIVTDSLEQNFSCQVKFIVETAITALLDISLIWLSNERLQIRQKSLAASSIGID
jgi:hypothetical protein